MKKRLIKTDPEKCTGCRQCQLACSYRYTGEFNPEAARIKIMLSPTHCEIEFTDHCDECGACADQCFYGALEKLPREAAS